jgi:predicted nucleic acid-binding protein
MTQRTIVLDANILIRAVLGERVRQLITDHAAEVSFFAPESPYAEAREHLPALLERRGVSGAVALATLDALETVVRPIEAELYQEYQQPALARIAERDADDWPALACALLLSCPVWTEDADFFGTGVATWTTSRVKLYLAPEVPKAPEES